MPRPKKIKEEVKVDEIDAGVPQPEEIKKEISKSEPETVSIPKLEWDQVQATLKMLKEVADKGRIYNYEASQKTDKKPVKAKLAVHDGGLIIGWSNMLKDEIIKHPVTGLPVGESQEVEVDILLPDNSRKKKRFASYVSFSDARYNERVEVTRTSTRESQDGSIKWTVLLPDGRELEIDPKFVN